MSSATLLSFKFHVSSFTGKNVPGNMVHSLTQVNQNQSIIESEETRVELLLYKRTLESATESNAKILQNNSKETLTICDKTCGRIV